MVKFIYRNQTKGQPIWNWMYSFDYEPEYSKIPPKEVGVKAQKPQPSHKIQRQTQDSRSGMKGKTIRRREGRK